MEMGSDTTYFDSVVFLTMFLLAGRYLESHSKAKTADAVNALASLRPANALLVEPTPPSVTSADSASDTINLDLEKGDLKEQTASTGVSAREISVDFLELGDIVRVPHGSTPPGSFGYEF